MARAPDDTVSLRFGRRESGRVIAALLLSALLHLTIWGGYHAGNKQGWWAKWRLPAWLHQPAKRNPQLAQHPLAAPAKQAAEPTTFVDVSHADTDVPAQPKYYSNKNSRAANQEIAATDTPRIEGRQTDIPKTEDVPKLVKKAEAAPPEPAPAPAKEPSPEPAKANPAQTANLQPSMPPLSLPMPTLPATAQTDAQPPQTPGETDPRRPRTGSAAQARTQAQTAAQPKSTRPRTLRQALAKNDQLPGQQMQQAGGVPVHRMWSSLDAKAVPFGDYDRQLIEAVQQRWDDLLESHQYAEDRAGKVVLRFKLKPDGAIIEMQTVESTVGELLGYLCQEAIEEAAPFSPWPPDMERMIGANYREVTFTFYYY